MSSKRKSSGAPACSSKRSRRNSEADRQVIIIDSDGEPDMDEDEELKDILAQIEAQENRERLGKENLGTNPSSSTSAATKEPSHFEDDAALARRLAEEWASYDDSQKDVTNVDGSESDIEIIPNNFSSSVNDKRKRKASSSRAVPSPNSARTYKAGTISIKPDVALGDFRHIFTNDRECSKCKAAVSHPRGRVMFSDSELPPSLTFLLHAPCKKCRTNHCRGCFTPILCPISCKGPSKNADCQVLTCCAEIRAIAIFETLGGLDGQYLNERAAANTRAQTVTKKKSSVKSVGPGGTGYGNDNYRGYSADKITTGRQGKKSNFDWEKIFLRALTVLIKLLPEPYAEDPQVYDMLPHSSIGHLLSLSQVPTILADLLRNDSVTDWITRKDTYNAMLSFLRRMADCELTIQCLIGHRWESESPPGIESWMWEEGEMDWILNNLGESEAAPLYSYFKKLTKQSEAFLAGAEKLLGDDDDTEVEEMIQTTSLCGDIIAARDDLERAIAVLGQPEIHSSEPVEPEKSSVKKTNRKGKGKDKAQDLSLILDNAYIEECERLSFKHVSFEISSKSGVHYGNYYYHTQLSQTENSTRLPKSRLHLLKELAVTATSLPPGVWVRVDEVRNDALKIMIAGPEKTPYAGGLFEFDCFLPLDYPNRPPLMQLKTTGGGTVRFNPNLYNDGKVCLSLLGTWEGRPEEKWSSKSTLLQVLVSIQSMILIDAPYFNEPGYGIANLNNPASITYNRDIASKTVKWAMVEWMKEEHSRGIWGDVIASHFRIRNDRIRQQIVEWSLDNAAIRSFSTTNPYAGYYNMDGQPPPANKGGKVDLLVEFDKGVKLIQSWHLELEDGNDI